MKKTLTSLLIILLFSQITIYAQTEKSIIGINLGDTRENVSKNFYYDESAQKISDNNVGNFPINYEIFSKMEMKFNGIPIEKITFSYFHDILIAINIETKPSDDVDLLLDSRRVLKEYYNLEKQDWIDIDEEFYKRTNQAFYSSNDNPDFVLVIYGSESRGRVSQNYTFLIKSKANEAADLKRKYQQYSSINNYTLYSLDELEKLSKEKKQQEEVVQQKQQKETKKKKLVDDFMGGVSGFYLTGGIINGDNAGNFGAFDFSFNIFGPFSLGCDLRLGAMDNRNNGDYDLRADIDAYLSLGLGIPITKKYEPPIIFVAIAPGAFMYQRPNTNRYSNKEMINENDTFMEYRAGFQFSISDWIELRFVYAKEKTKQNGDMDLFTFAIGGRF